VREVKNLGKLRGKVAVITGASSGIGRATAILFAKEGAKVVVAARTLEKLKETVRVIKTKRGEATAVKADVSSTKDVQNIFETTINTYGQLDILFNNAGVEQPYYMIHELPEEIWDKVININLKGVFLGMKYGIPHMLKRGGVIINTASPASFSGIPYEPSYCASKGGVLLLTKAAAYDYADRNIRVNCICPGATATPMIEREWSGPQWEKIIAHRWLKKAPIDRVVPPEEIAPAVLFLACDDSSFATGSTLVIDGGFSAI
jgi:NAD(P)-dependent dehydrogenase (short-subunit alcohol dehydrogenase family)